MNLSYCIKKLLKNNYVIINSLYIFVYFKLKYFMWFY